MNSRVRTVLLMSAAAVIAAGGTFLFTRRIGGTRQAERQIVTQTGTVLRLDANTEESLSIGAAEEAPGIAIPGWVSLTVPSGTTTAGIALNNPADNEGWYYMTFELTLVETGEVLFTTGLVPPGMYCNEVKLSRELTPGEYRARMCVQPYFMNDDLTATNNMEYELRLIAE